MGRLQQRAWTAEDSSARSVVEVLAEELGPSDRDGGGGDHDQDHGQPVAGSTTRRRRPFATRAWAAGRWRLIYLPLKKGG
jgi:single-stranded DNA-binding protein